VDKLNILASSDQEEVYQSGGRWWGHMRDNDTNLYESQWQIC